MWRYLLRFTRLNRHRVSRLLNTQCNSQTSPTFIKTLSFAIPFAWWPFEFLKEKDVHEQIRQSFNDCLFLIAKGEFKEADDKLHELLYFANQSYQNKQLTDLEYVNKRARICSEMANLNLLMGNHSAAEKLIRQTMEDCLTGGLSPNDSVFVELSLKMALIFEKSDRMTDAETGFRFCIQTQEEKLTNMDEDIDCTNEKALLGMCCNYFAKFLFTNRRPTEALVYAQRAYNIASQIYPLDHPNCLNILIDISAIQVDLNQFKESQHTLEQVIEASQTRYQSFTDEYKIDPNLLKSNYSKQYEIYQILYTLIHSLLQLAVVKIMSNNQESVKQLLLQANQILDQSRQMGLKTSMHRKQIDDFIVEHHV
ncbi:unnamed protein product [Heterobilharzia americana]|nr:unnamed protein product [Heterobilharzia americana]